VAANAGERGRNWWGQARGSSLYATAMLHPAAAAGIAAATVALAGAAWRVFGGRRRQAPKSTELEFGLS